MQEAQVDPHMCFRNGSVADAFERPANPVRGTSDVDALPNIGSYLKGKLQAANIVTINDFLMQSMVHNTQLKLEKFISDLVPNRRAHTCVADTSSGKQKYHVSDVNTCGYNTLLKVVQFAHQHVNNFAQFGFNQAFPCALSIAMPMRHRGRTKGSRHCVCHLTNHSCQVDGHGECRWQNNTCLPRGGGGQDAGFRGIVVPHNNSFKVRNQRIPNVHNTNNYLGRPYKLGWMVFPNQAAQGRGRGAQGRGAQGRGRGAQGRGAQGRGRGAQGRGRGAQGRGRGAQGRGAQGRGAQGRGRGAQGRGRGAQGRGAQGRGAQGRGAQGRGRGAQGRGRGAQGRGGGQPNNFVQPNNVMQVAVQGVDQQDGNLGILDQQDALQEQPFQAQPQQVAHQVAQPQQVAQQVAQPQQVAQQVAPPQAAQQVAQQVAPPQVAQQVGQPQQDALRRSNRVRRPNSKYLKDDYLMGGCYITMKDFDDLLEVEEERLNKRLKIVNKFRTFLLAT